MLGSNTTPLESIRESLHDLGIPQDDWEAFIAATLLALRGWAGMIHQIELRGDRVVRPIPAGSLIEFVAIRLVLDRCAFRYAVRQELRFDGSLAELRQALRAHVGPANGTSNEDRAFQVFQIAQVMGWTPKALGELSNDQWSALVREIEGFPSLDRRRVLHLAYEKAFFDRSLDTIALHSRKRQERPKNPRFQALFCIDEREESFRRHLEELAPDVETASVAGFFAVAMYYRGAADAHFNPLCPIIIRPNHHVVERVADGLEKEHERRAGLRRLLGKATHRCHLGSRSLSFGASLMLLVGVLASLPLVGRVLFPRLAAWLRKRAGKAVAVPPSTRLQLERHGTCAGPEWGNPGYTLEEMANIGERVLRESGLATGFSRLVLVIGHGSTSLNNPHISAYNCGACGGGAGGPNARALAQLLNDARVRMLLAERNIHVPTDTVFVGGMHNTCNDTVTFFDRESIPESHGQDLSKAVLDINRTCERNAHERCRRFISAPLGMSFAAARQHVEERSEDLAQARPECGHATNALLIVGRRERTRGLYLDRRAFLNSYDPNTDDADASLLAKVLGAAIPVCGGINLEYYFSYVDNNGYGCGTKLPHNVTSLLGVMDGAASDLRTGLPWQMVEIHEPVRLLCVIETTPEKMMGIIDRNPGISVFVRNEWVKLAVLDPHSPRIQVFRNGTFVDHHPKAETLPQAASSVEWYRGWREHLEFAQIAS
jgi:uncharacterized protein YbcC (UPF0753/DUF2309 family)